MLHREPKVAPEYIYPVDEWRIIEKRFARRYLEQSETIFTLANGYMGIRGAFEEGRPAFQNGTFINGFHETTPIVYGETAYGFAETAQTMLNVADAKLLRLFVDDEPFIPEHANLIRFERVLNMRDGRLERTALWETPAGKRVEIRSIRLVSFEHRHLAAVDYEVVVHNSGAPVVLISEMILPPDALGNEANRAASQEPDPGKIDPRRSRNFNERILLPVLQRCEDQRIILGHRTRNSAMTIACGMDHVVRTECGYSSESHCQEDRANIVYTVAARPGQSFRITKYITYHTSHNAPVSELIDRSARTLVRSCREGWQRLCESQRRHVDDFWQRSDVRITGDLRVQQSLRWNLFQLLQASARVEGAGIGARGLTGQTYEGHYFWDTEIYLLPFLIYTAPRIAGNLLRFRHSMLPAARRRARQVGEKGALFPWRTINGEEASAYYAAGTAQYHIDADIVHAIRKYVEMSGDPDFLASHGAEILVETARLWLSLGFYSEQKNGQFCINGVTGPDEYNAVVDNNLFTNMMARENMRYAADVMTSLHQQAPERYAALVDRTGFRPEETDDWRCAADAMYIPFDEKLGIHLQDDNFLDRQLWDLESEPTENFPLLLHYHPLVIYRHRVIKQADVVLALFLLGNVFSAEEKRRNFDYYDPLTTGDSSLSVCIQSIIAAENGYGEEAFEYFRYAVLMDLADIGGNVRDGVHVASIGGTWMALTYGLAGMRDHGGMHSFNPRLPNQWEGMSFPLMVRGSELEVELVHDQATYRLRKGGDLTIRHQGQEVTLREGESATLAIRRPEKRPAFTIETVIPRDKFDAVLFDMDGVLTATAEVHALAWKEMFDEFLKKREQQLGEPFRPFEIGTDYLLLVDGKPRENGTHDFLASRGIQLPKGSPEDGPGMETEWGLSNRKNDLVQEIIRSKGVHAYPGSIRLLHRLRRDGVRTAVVTSSANADLTLEAAGIADLFDAKVDGNVAAELGLAGKPDPDPYLEAARRLGAAPARAVVIEDALSGVQAGKRGGFGLVLGVARSVSPDEMRRNGADVVVADLGDLLPD
ncbi:MAG: family 65 glycosyl hydrolase [Deltaproteobacteria bacterium HGW-Deltaproteobacteria-21]|nr:MAG: family 65 glycosyl hydrolase [Deltaproteobacteria bacterium HGW-Deltaproteobacteria-21]